MKTRKKSHSKIISLIFLLLWMGLIFFFSGQTASESSAVSGGFIESIAKIMMPFASPQRIADIAANLQFVVRKGTHFSIYAVLGILAFITYTRNQKHRLTLPVLFAWLTAAAYSVTDEFHQTFVPGRSGELRDICIDSCGALTGVLLALAVTAIHRKIRSKEVHKMKKKEYDALVEELRARLDTTLRERDELKGEVQTLQRESESLNSKLFELREQLCEIEKRSAANAEITDCDEPDNGAGLSAGTAPSVESGKASVPPAEIPDDLIDGSQIIGKIVLNAAKCCNELTRSAQGDDVKELVNLILGRTEVAKGEILSITSLDTDPQSKLSAMEKELHETEDYFESVMAQK